jgi:hypothetical protein
MAKPMKEDKIVELALFLLPNRVRASAAASVGRPDLASPRSRPEWMPDGDAGCAEMLAALVLEARRTRVVVPCDICGATDKHACDCNK